MTTIQLSLVIVYMCILLIKTCDESSSSCEAFGLGNTSKGLFLFFVR